MRIGAMTGLVRLWTILAVGFSRIQGYPWHDDGEPLADLLETFPRAMLMERLFAVILTSARAGSR